MYLFAQFQNYVALVTSYAAGENHPTGNVKIFSFFLPCLFNSCTLLEFGP